MKYIQKLLRNILIAILTPLSSVLAPDTKNINVIKTLDLYDKGFVRIFSKIRFWDAPLVLMARYVPDSGTILDLGCGDGLFTNYLGLLSHKRKLVGIELNKRRVKDANRGLKNVKFSYGDVLRVKFPTQLNAILMTHLLHHLPSFWDQERLIEKSHTSLKKGGSLIIAEVGSSPLYKRVISWLTDAFIVPILFENKAYSFNFYYRKDKDWLELLKKQGFSVKMVKAHKNTPFSHIILVATKK